MEAGRVLTAGRSENNGIAIQHPTVSPRHIELRVNDDGSFDVFDLGDTAGTFVFHKGKWTRFEHATVAGDEPLRLGTYETTADELIEMAGEPGGPANEDIHEVTTRLKGERRRGSAEGDAGEHQRVTRGKSDRASKQGSQTKKLPPRHAASKKTSRPPSRPAPRPAKPDTEKMPAGHAAETPPKIGASPSAQKSLTVAYLLWAFLGGFGAHRFYLGSIGIGITHVTFLVVGVAPVAVFGGGLFDKMIPTVFVLLGIALLTGLVVWLIVDGFLIPGLVQDRRAGPGAKT